MCLCPTQQVRAQKPYPAVMRWSLYQTAPAAPRHGAEQLAVHLFIQSELNVLRVQTTSHSTLYFLGSSAVHPPSVMLSQSPEALPRCDVTVFISNSPHYTQTRSVVGRLLVYSKFINIKCVVCPNCTKRASVNQ